jgi:hypothetical protein
MLEAGVAVIAVAVPEWLLVFWTNAGGTTATGVTLFDCAESGPVPIAFDALTVKLYVVPLVSPVIVVLVVGGVPVIVVGVCGTSPAYGVIV